ncbi:MAG: DUF1269 domain-containing protein [Lachnospiraceae bacterium]|nr:DUF1269 domain-containing protein [Lachnospiraceae bacterium]
MKAVIIMKFDSESKSYQAFSEIKKLHASRQLIGDQMAVLEHRPNHLLDPKDFIDFTGANNNVKGGLIGMLIGILAGPLGIILGWFAGSVIGSSKDVKGALSIFEETIKTIPEGETGVILIADELQTGPIDDLVVNELGGVVVRLNREDVERDMQEAKETQEEVEEQAKKRWFKKN